jgi:hypothetical protein
MLYAAAIAPKTEQMVSLLGFATNHSKPELIEEFYGLTSAVVIIKDQGLADTRDWENMEPLKIIRHDEKIVQPFHPFEVEETFEPMVFTLDVLALMLQYRAWRLDNLEKGVEGESIHNFIYNYVMVNTVSTFMDLSLVNLYLSDASELTIIDTNSPIITSKHDKQIMNVIEDVKDNMLLHREIYPDMLTIMPTLAGTAADTLHLRVTYISTNNMEAYYIARSEYFMKIMETFGEDVKKPNTTLINDYEITTRRAKSANVIGKMSKHFDMTLSEAHKGR